MAGDYDVKCWRVGSQDDPYAVFSDAFTEGSALNFTRFTDPRIDEAIVTLRTTADNEDRKTAVETIRLVLAEQVQNTFTSGTRPLISASSELTKKRNSVVEEKRV